MMVKHRMIVTGAALVASLATLLAGCGSDGGGTGGSTGGSGGAGGGSTTTEPTCAVYCDTVMTNCAGEQGVYVSKEVCLAACKHVPIGKAEDTTGNTLGCRTYHAGAAAGSVANATLHCPHAGPGGAGYCGSNCEGYCNLAQGVCSTFAGTAECTQACAGFTDMEPFTAAAVTGDTMQCRLYHASVAASDKIHCDHIGLMPSPGTCTAPTP